MSSGVIVNSACEPAFQRLTEPKSQVRYVIYKIEDKEIVVETAGLNEELGYDDNSKAAYEAFIEDLKERTDGFNDCRYAVFDFKFTCDRRGAGASKMSKLVFIQVCPDKANIKKKMVYAASASAIKTTLGTERFLQFQVADESEIAHEELFSMITEKYRDN